MRGGRKKKPVYRIVAADSRRSRDGRFLERLGTYNPLLENAQQVTLKEDRVMHWLEKGAQPTDTTRNIFSAHGLMLKLDLLKRGTSEESIEELVNKFKEEKAASFAKKAGKVENAKEKKVAETNENSEDDVKTEEPSTEEKEVIEAKVEEASVEEKSVKEDKADV